MLDPCDKHLSDQGSESVDVIRNNTNEGSSEEGQNRTCFDCGTSKTPLWRGGPAGPKSLCNACGIRSRKKRRAILEINKTSTNISSGSSSDENHKASKKSGVNKQQQKQQLGDGLKERLLALGREVLMQRSTVERQWRTLGEEEQAAVLLMALSYGSVSA